MQSMIAFYESKAGLPASALCLKQLKTGFLSHKPRVEIGTLPATGQPVPLGVDIIRPFFKTAYRNSLICKMS